jgi:ABC-type antimicrobial peptide transport system permease subunit
VINERLAKFYFSNTNPLGRHITIGRKEPKTYTIVGVSRDAIDHDLTDEVQRRFYTPFFQTKDLITTYNFEVRTSGDAAALSPGIRKIIQQVDRNLKIEDLKPLTVMMDSTIGEERLVAQLSTGLGGLALLLAATGLYGVMAYATSRRSGEIGLRMALGADRSRVVWMVLREALWLSFLGIVIGVPCALAAAKLVEHNLSGLSTADPLVMTSAVAVMIATALMAGFLPAARASRIDPMTALRQE